MDKILWIGDRQTVPTAPSGTNAFHVANWYPERPLREVMLVHHVEVHAFWNYGTTASRQAQWWLIDRPANKDRIMPVAAATYNVPEILGDQILVHEWSHWSTDLGSGQFFTVGPQLQHWFPEPRLVIALGMVLMPLSSNALTTFWMRINYSRKTISQAEWDMLIAKQGWLIRGRDAQTLKYQEH